MFCLNSFILNGCGLLLVVRYCLFGYFGYLFCAACGFVELGCYLLMSGLGWRLLRLVLVFGFVCFGFDVLLFCCWCCVLVCGFDFGGFVFVGLFWFYVLV